MTTVLYSIIIIFATFMGAYVGLGGGVIIKPLLDLIGKDPINICLLYTSDAADEL